MGVDYFTCHYCEDAFPDCGHYVSCEGCRTHWCSDECAKADGYIEEHCKKYYVYGYEDLKDEKKIRKCEYKYCVDCPDYEPDSCKYCRKEDYDDYVLLDKALELLNMTREDLVKVINDEN